MDGFGMVLIALRPHLRHPVPAEVPGDQPQDFKRFDLEALKQPEEVRAQGSQPTLSRYGAAGCEWTLLRRAFGAAGHEQKGTPQPQPQTPKAVPPEVFGVRGNILRGKIDADLRRWGPEET